MRESGFLQLLCWGLVRGAHTGLPEPATGALVPLGTQTLRLRWPQTPSGPSVLPTWRVFLLAPRPRRSTCFDPSTLQLSWGPRHTPTTHGHTHTHTHAHACPMYSRFLFPFPPRPGPLHALAPSTPWPLPTAAPPRSCLRSTSPLASPTPPPPFPAFSPSPGPRRPPRGPIRWARPYTPQHTYKHAAALTAPVPFPPPPPTLSSCCVSSAMRPLLGRPMRSASRGAAR